MPRVRLGDRLRYRFDNWMSRGSTAVIGLLALATLLFVLALALLVVLLGAHPDGRGPSTFWDIAWGNLMRTLDPGTMGGDAGWGYRILMLVVTVGGLVVVASLIGIVSGAFDDKMVELRKGRSRVLEKGHTTILGWNSQLFTILSELSSANASRKRNVIVVLADRDKVETDEAIRAQVPHSGSTTIICRRGNPISQADLMLASPTTARSVVVLADGESEHPDSAVIKTVMALSNHTDPGSGPPVIAELKEYSNLDAARLAGGESTKWVLADDLISRITVQTCLQPGLSTVCTELLDFAGDEIYLSSQPRLTGRTCLDAQLAFDGCTVMGVAREGAVRLNPPPDDVLVEGDELIVIAADDASIGTAGEPVHVDMAALSPAGAVPRRPERVLILGFNTSVQKKLDDLCSYLAPGSSITVVSNTALPTLSTPDEVLLETSRADTTDRRVLEGLDLAGFDHVLILAYRGVLDIQAADAQTLITLLHLRDIVDRGGLRINVVSEMLDDRNRELAEVTHADDFIVSDRLTSLILAQVSENRALIEVFEELFSSGGNEMYLRAAELYVTPGDEVDFHTVAASASRRGETAIGYRIAAHAHSRGDAYGVHLNPPRTTPLVFAPSDQVIVLAESS